jgi:hypothetical protein
MTSNQRMTPPVRIRIKCTDGKRRTYYGAYSLIAKYRASGQLVAARSTSTGKAIA